MAKIRQFFQRMIAVAPRVCGECDDEIPEGGIYFKTKNGSIYCGSCKDYDDNRE